MAGCRHAKFVFLESEMLGLHDSNEQHVSYYCVRILVDTVLMPHPLPGATAADMIGRPQTDWQTADPQAGAAAGNVGLRVHTRVGKLWDARPHVHTRAHAHTRVYSDTHARKCTQTHTLTMRHCKTTGTAVVFALRQVAAKWEALKSVLLRTIVSCVGSTAHISR